MKRWVKVQLISLALVVPALLVVVAVTEGEAPAVRWQIVIGFVVGLAAQLVAERLVRR